MKDRLDRPAPPATARLLLHQLLAALDYAGYLGKYAWQFEVEVQSLRSAGLTNSDLRWLVCQGFIEHGIEATQGREVQRLFQPARNLALDKRSCFVLTAAGLALVRHDPARSRDPSPSDQFPGRATRSRPALGRRRSHALLLLGCSVNRPVR
jgi:hypothetical protein